MPKTAASAADQRIVRAAIYPAIGIARVGNSPDEYFIGPEVLAAPRVEPGFYKDRQGALKRQAARFRVYGLDEAGQVVRELTAADADITWHVHVANKKAAWYEFNTAMDIPEAIPVGRRNANFVGEQRAGLVIDPGALTIAGAGTEGAAYHFDQGRFLGEPVYLGELRTDEQGRLLFLGGHGVSNSPFPDNPPTTFANNDGWHDDTSDGPVNAQVTYQGRELPVQGAWVVCAPPNYAPDVIGIQTMYDVIADALQIVYITPKKQPSFQEDIYPLLSQFSQSQWVNQGFYVAFGHGQAYDFANPETLRRLSTITRDPQTNEVTDDYREYRRQIFNYFRSPTADYMDPTSWPWMYGDNMNLPPTTPNAYFTLTPTLYGYLTQWAAGDFVADWNPAAVAGPAHLEEVSSPQEQADMLTKAALWYCLGGPFHPGCEMTWPMRLSGMYTAAFRVRQRSANNPEPDFGPLLQPAIFSADNPGPAGAFWNGPGDLTRWMACPWQADTASCRAGYVDEYDPLVPTFWPARVPNTVLTEEDYRIVMDSKRPHTERLDAFNRRASWYRILGAEHLVQLQNMVAHFGDMGVVEYRPGLPGSADFPAAMYVETPPYAAGAGDGTALRASQSGATLAARQQLVEAAARIPRNQGLYVGPVGKGAPRRQPAPPVVVAEIR
ncbi:LodA/GoxA family CTQ-dependent oxidase [Hymenobacter sp. ASUV-10]|uniref:LodA/GoxA family CTQ-dependent oxidase n=1 Tax=Hymenobacter aranciens TaxID=3063996 RepID=A0ABT9B916_9BACT|nr:LodA/GoxA family CTQ-dependent oxidase [Hymenobacter sp. ASUV-10]MDO7874762.1 LodA/GoxA family CTQ-dependent oxidase [Hymenobacter sp. ASUV-10]